MANRGIVVYTYMVADLLHRGHLRALLQARALGDYLIVGILIDDAVIAYKRCPVIPFEERIELVSHLDCVDLVLPQDNVDPTPNLELVQPDILTHGDDWAIDKIFGADWMIAHGKQVIQTKYYPYQSTTKIIKAIRQNKEV